MTRPRLTGGQRASAALAGLTSHILFSIGWFGLGFALIAGALGGLLQVLISKVDFDAIRQLFTSAGSIVWIIILVFGVGSLLFVVLSIVLSGALLRRGDVHRPWGVTTVSLIIAAVIDFPIFLLGGVITRWTTNSQAGLVFLPPLFSLVLVLVTGALVWLWMAHVFRAKAPTDPATVEGSHVVAVPVDALPVNGGAAPAAKAASGADDGAGEAADALQ